MRAHRIRSNSSDLSNTHARKSRAIQRAGDRAVEQLEERRLLSFTAHINFQPTGLSDYSGDDSDTGGTYTSHGSLTYGWDHAATMVARSTDPDQRKDTFAEMEDGTYGALTWEISVPNGNYSVHVVGGDPTSFSGHFDTEVEGSTVYDTALHHIGSFGNHWAEGTISVTGADGELTITDGPSASGNKINYVDIGDVPATPGNVKADPLGRNHSARVSWDTVAGAGSYTAWELDGDENWQPVGTVDSSESSYLVSGLSEATEYSFAVTANNANGPSPMSDTAATETGRFAMYNSATFAHGYTGTPIDDAGMNELEHSNAGYVVLLEGQDLDNDVDIPGVTALAKQAAGISGHSTHVGEERNIIIDFEEPSDYTDSTAVDKTKINHTIANLITILDTIHGVWNSISGRGGDDLRVGVYGLPIVAHDADSEYMLSHAVLVDSVSRTLAPSIDFFSRDLYVDLEYREEIGMRQLGQLDS